jgi:diguanylate cyclase (GGDEF)-like protein
LKPIPTPDDVAAATEILRRGVDSRRSFCLAVARLLRADVVSLWECERDEMRLTASTASIPIDGSWRLAKGSGSAAGRAATDGRRFFAADAPTDPDVDDDNVAHFGLASVLAEPVRIEGRIAGAVTVGWKQRVEALDPLVSGYFSLMVVQAAMAIERADLSRRLERQALTDPLTELPNRRGLARELDREMARSARRGSPLGFALMDLDNFKAYNDTNGHAAGDRLLVRAARAWGSRIRAQDLLARYGGEEFVLLLPDCAIGPIEPLEIVERVRAATPDGQTVSAGLAIWDGREPAHRLAERADAALYAAKERGRDRALAA